MDRYINLKKNSAYYKEAEEIESKDYNEKKVPLPPTDPPFSMTNGLRKTRNTVSLYFRLCT